MSRPDPDTELATLVRDAAPRPEPEFLERLDARVAERFGKPERTRPSWLKRPRWPVLGALAASGAAAAVIVVVATGGSAGTSSNSASSAALSEDTATQSAEVQPKREATPAPSASAGAAAPAITPAPGTGTIVPKPSTRRVIRDTSLSLTTSPKDFAATSDDVIATADRFGGIVQTSNVDQTGSTGHATFDLRIPASRLDEAVAALSKLGHVRSRTAASQDVTSQFLSAQERLTDARAERGAILRALAKADTAAETASLRARLRDANARLAQARGELKSLRQRTDYVRVAVTVDAAKRGEAVPGTGGDDGRWTPGDALHDAGRILQTAAGIALIMLAIGLPLALLGALAAYGARITRRRRREAALG